MHDAVADRVRVGGEPLLGLERHRTLAQHGVIDDVIRFAVSDVTIDANRWIGRIARGPQGEEMRTARPVRDDLVLPVLRRLAFDRVPVLFQVSGERGFHDSDVDIELIDDPGDFVLHRVRGLFVRVIEIEVTAPIPAEVSRDGAEPGAKSPNVLAAARVARPDRVLAICEKIGKIGESPPAAPWVASVGNC